MDKPTNPLDLEEIKGLMERARQAEETRLATRRRLATDFSPEADEEVRSANLDAQTAEALLNAAALRALPTLIEQYERMREAATKAAERFREYERHHLEQAAGSLTASESPSAALPKFHAAEAHRRADKAARNREMAELLESALTQQEETNGYRS